MEHNYSDFHLSIVYDHFFLHRLWLSVFCNACFDQFVVDFFELSEQLWWLHVSFCHDTVSLTPRL